MRPTTSSRTRGFAHRNKSIVSPLTKAEIAKQEYLRFLKTHVEPIAALEKKIVARERTRLEPNWRDYNEPSKCEDAVRMALHIGSPETREAYDKMRKMEHQRDAKRLVIALAVVAFIGFVAVVLNIGVRRGAGLV